MNKDSIWEELKRDGTEVYGQSMMDMFLRTTEELDPRHFAELPESKKGLVSPQTVLGLAQTPEEAEEAIRKGASEFWEAVPKTLKRDDAEMALFMAEKIQKKEPHKKKVKDSILSSAIEYRAVRCVGALIDAGATPFDDGLEAAAAEGSIEIARRLLKARPDLDIHRALDQAARLDNQEVLKFFADEFAKDPDYEPERDLAEALGSAAHFGIIKNIEFLLDRGAGDLGQALKKAVRGMPRRESKALEAVGVLLRHGGHSETEDAILWASEHIAGYLGDEARDKMLDALTSTPVSLRTAQRLARRSEAIEKYLDGRASRIKED